MGLKTWVAKRLSFNQPTTNRSIMQSLYATLGYTISAQTFQNLEQLIKEGFQRNVDVYSVINWLSENEACVPIYAEFKNGDEWERDPNSDLQKLIDRPNKYQSGIEHRNEVFGFYHATGNSFVSGTKLDEGVNSGKIKEMRVMPSQYTDILTGGWFNPVKGYTLDIDGGCLEFSFEDVMHLKTLTLDYGEGRELFGMSPLRAGLLSLTRSNSNYEYASSSFKNGGITGILQTERDEYAPNLTDEQRKYEEERIREDYKGVFNTGKTMVTNADVKWHQMGFSPVDLNLLKDKQATLRDICNIYKVSSILFNDHENSTYNNVSEAKKSAYNDAVIPMVDRYVQELNDWLVPGYGEGVRIVADYSEIPVLQTDKKQLAERLVMEVQAGMITRAEAREELGKSPIENEAMDVITVPMGVTPINDILFDPFIETEAEQKALGEHYLNIKNDN